MLSFTLATGLAGAAFASPIGGALITPSTALPSSGAGFTINQIADGITADGPFNGFAAIPGQVGTIRLDLASVYDLSSFVLWNDINVFQEGIKNFRLDFFDAANTALGSSPIYVGPIGQVAPQTYVFSSTVPGVKRVDLVVLSLHPSSCCGPRLEIREVAFNGELPVPAEGTSWGRLKSQYH